MFNNVDWIGCSTYVLQIRNTLEGKQPDGLRRFAYEYMTSPSAYEYLICSSAFSLCETINSLSVTNLTSDGGTCVGSFDRAVEAYKKQMPLLQKGDLPPVWSLSCRSPLPKSFRWTCSKRAAAETICREMACNKSITLRLPETRQQRRLQDKSTAWITCRARPALRSIVRTQEGTMFRNLFSINY